MTDTVGATKPELQVAGEQERNDSRLEGLVSNLRNDTTFSDADVGVGAEAFPVHLCVICGLSDFFLKAFSDPLKEAEKRSMKIEYA